MIVFTNIKRRIFHVCPGDTFNMLVKSGVNSEEIITEKISERRTIDFIASFRFATDDGKCLGFHLSGFFGDSKNLPLEIRQAKRLEDLTESQRKNFIATVGSRSITKEEETATLDEKQTQVGALTVAVRRLRKMLKKISNYDDGMWCRWP